MQTLEITDLGNRETVRANSKRAEEIVKITLDKIEIRDGFNVRLDMGDIQGLAQSILENGQQLPGRVDCLSDGTFLLTDGHRRYKAMQLLEQQGNECLFQAIVNDRKTTEEQRIIQMFATQDNKQLQAHEVSELIRRLMNLGHNQKTVAKKIGRTPSYVSQMLDFSRESVDVKSAVSSGKLSVSGAMKIKKQMPSSVERSEKVKQAVESGKKIKIQDVTGKDLKKEWGEHVATQIFEEFRGEILNHENDFNTMVKLLMRNY